MKIFFTISLALLIVVSGLAQSITVSGKVSDAETGEGLIGANVIVKGTNTGTITDIEGNYQLSLSDANATLVFRYIGYATKEVPVNNQTEINVSLETDYSELDEVVVVGYGSVRKSDLTGAVSSIKTDELVKVPSASPVQALQGKVSGLQVMSASGDPGSAPVVRLRGIGTLNNNNPLFVVDGVIINNENGSALDFLNANDIESVEVLKDASALAIFGSRGSNGVILITTKQGTKGAMRLSFSAEQGFETVSNPIGVMSGREFATYVNEIEQTYNNLDVLPNVDWQDEVFQTNTPIRNYNASLSGGSDNVSYYFGLGYYFQEGVVPKSDLERITTKLNTTFSITNDLDIGLNLSVALKDKQNAPGVINTALRAWPIDEPTDANGNFSEVRGSANAVAAIAYSNSNTKSLESVGNLFAEYKFLDGFSFKSSFQFTLGVNKTKSFTPEFFVAPLQQNETSDINQSYNDNSLVIFENTLSYNKEFDIHRINAVAGYTTQQAQGEFLSGSAQNLLREGEDFWYINASDRDPLLQNVSNSGSHSSMISYLVRANYSLMNKYLFTASFRRDGSSKFGINNRWGNFPSFAFGWNISEEAFFPKADIIDNVKFRASWGIVGNDKIPGNDQFSTIGTGNRGAVFGVDERLVSGASFTSGGNPDLRWEETEQVNFGINADFFKGRLITEFDYYVRTTNDILVNLEPAGYVGFGPFQSIRYNAASVENSGLEFNLNWRDQIGDVSYSIGALGSIINNEVTNLAQDIGADSVLTAGDLGNGQRVSRTVVGQPIGFFYGYEVQGVFQNDEQLNQFPKLQQQRVGDFIYRDVNGDGVLNADDRTIIGNSIPDFVFGFNASANYRGFGLSMDFQGQSGVDIYNGKQVVTFALTNFEDKFLNRWNGEGTTNEHPRATQGGVNYNPSNYFIEDGSFLRLRTLTLSYDFPTGIKELIKANTLRVYVRGTNLITWTKFTGYSPDLGAGSPLDGVIDRGVYPITRIYSVGMNLTF